MQTLQAFISILILLVIQNAVPSSQVFVSPCRVENFVTHPHFGTKLVQIVQIPPVFTQSVMVGKCLNATTSETSNVGNPGSHFLCKQRYSTVEVYIMEPTLVTLPLAPVNSSKSEILSRFTAGNFYREFVVVESGCDFTFNLLPLLMQQRKAWKFPQTVGNAPSPQNYMFLSSPYHNPTPSATALEEAAVAGPAQQGGNLENYESLSVSGAYDERSHAHAQGHKKPDATTTPTPKGESQLYRVSDKIGVPLYILSPAVDPLLNNIEGQGS